jgi:hypothetical protein
MDAMPWPKGRPRKVLEPSAAPPPIPEPEDLPSAEFGRLAALLANNAAVAKAFKDVANRYAGTWAGSAELESVKREKLYDRVVALRDIHNELQLIWNTTKHEAMRKDRIANLVA